MDGQRRFAVIGTDPRLAAAGRALARAGFAVGGPEQTALADYILLPAPLDESRTPLAELPRAANRGRWRWAESSRRRQGRSRRRRAWSWWTTLPGRS